MSVIILPGALPAAKVLCEKARARSLPCTTDMCDHTGAWIMVLSGDDSWSDTNRAPCKACGAEPPETDVFARARADIDASNIQ